MKSATHGVTTLLDDLLPAIQEALVDTLVGVYVRGSLAWTEHRANWVLRWTSAVGTSPVPGQTLEVK